MDSQVESVVPQFDTVINSSSNVPKVVPVVASCVTQRWKMAELQLLISLKKLEYEHGLYDTPRDRIKSADARWKLVSGGMLKHGFNRKQTLIRKKWEKLMTDFKKIYDYQRRPPSGELGYFEMGSDDRKRFLLPPQYDTEVYKSMECWVPCRRAVQPDPDQLLDSSLDGGKRQPASFGNSPRSSVTGLQETMDEDSIGTRSEAPDVHPTSTTRFEEDTAPIAQENEESSEVPDHPSAHGHLLKKSKRDRLDEHFKVANADIVKAMASQSEQRELSDKANLDWEKEKHTAMADLDLKKHRETVIMQEKMSSEISGALRDVSASFMFFANAMSKRMEPGTHHH